jgi:hypothetical protein
MIDSWDSDEIPITIRNIGDDQVLGFQTCQSYRWLHTPTYLDTQILMPAGEVLTSVTNSSSWPLKVGS